MSLFQKKPLLYISLGALAFFIAAPVFIFAHRNHLASPLVLHFDAHNGITAFGTISDLWGIWIIAAFIAGLNVFLAKRFYEKERIIAYMLIAANVLLSLLSFIAIAVIISVN